MAAPDFVPTSPTQRVRRYSSPPRRNRSWSSDRPGDVTSPEAATGARLGTQGPDQGYVYKLVDQFELHLGGVARDDAVAACAAIATKRAGLFGRAPVSGDVEIAFRVWGFLDENPADDLVTLREKLFRQVRSNHHYVERREIVDMVSAATLRRSGSDIAMAYQRDWRNLIDS